MFFTSLFSLLTLASKEKQLHLTNTAPYLLERKMQMPPLMAESISSLLVHRIHFKSIVIFMMEIQSLFQVMGLILVELGFIVDASTCTKEPTLALYLMA